VKPFRGKPVELERANGEIHSSRLRRARRGARSRRCAFSRSVAGVAVERLAERVHFSPSITPRPVRHAVERAARPSRSSPSKSEGRSRGRRDRERTVCEHRRTASASLRRGVRLVAASPPVRAPAPSASRVFPDVGDARSRTLGHALPHRATRLDGELSDRTRPGRRWFCFGHSRDPS
jgi:hypothetical protein